MRGIRSGAITIAALVVATAGCGNDGSTEVVIEATPAGVARAVADTLDATSNRFTSEITMDVLGQELTFTMEGATDAAGRTEIVVDMGDLLESMGEVGDDPAAAAFLTEPMRVVTDGSTVYLCGGFARMLAGAECGSFSVPDFVDSGFSTADPLAQIRALVGAEDVEDLGVETVDGVAAAHLRGTVTMREALDKVAPEDAEALRGQFERIGGDVETILDEPMPFELWIDGDGHIRRYQQSFSFGELIPGAGAMSIDVRFRDFGADVEIELPDPADVADLSSFAGLPD